MLRLFHLAAPLLCAALPVGAESIAVTSNADAGIGTLRAALVTAARRNTATVIVIDVQNDIQIDETLIYDGTAPLSIIGSDHLVRTDQNVTLLAITNGANLQIAGLSFAGPGGFDINTRDRDAAGKGLFVAVPVTRTGTVSLTLDRVKVFDVAGHGIHISDCDLADACGGGGGGGGGGSDAGISVNLRDVTVRDVGNGHFDADGLRVDERGVGSITALIWSSQFVGVGADGVELDEGQVGSVVVQVGHTRFEDNGVYCHPEVLRAYLPDPDEGDFKVGARAVADIPGPITGSPDDACFEREVDLYDDGSVEAYEFSIDVDDGFDVDEAGPGGIDATLVDVVVTGNLDEGLDFDEEDAGDIHLSVSGGDYSRNSDDGIKLSEEDAGDIKGAVIFVLASDNGGKGLVFEEEDGGDLEIGALNVSASGNDDGDETGMEAVQEDSGSGFVTFVGPALADGMDVKGVELR